MKKAYNEIWIENIEKHTTIREWHDENLLSEQQYQQAKQLFPVGFYQPNIFIEFGAFIFTSLAVSATFGYMVAIFFSKTIETSAGLMAVCLAYGLVLVFLLEYFIKSRQLYRSGTDNALLYIAVGCFLTAVYAATDFRWPLYSYFLVSMLVFIPFLWRYGDPFVGIGIFLTWIGFWFMFTIEFPAGKLLVPFVMMGVSVLSFVGVKWWMKRPSAYYLDAQICIETGSLITFYLAGNYWVVREGNALLNNLAVSTQVQFAPLFYLFTALIPLVYLLAGLKMHDRKLVLTGIATAGFSIFTYRYYFAFLPFEWAITLGGAALTAFAVWGIWFLRKPRFNLTYQRNRAAKFSDFEAFLVSQALPHQSTEDRMKFGGGQFGGGGAGSGY